MRKLLIRLFPRAWRARYGVEFTALLEDSGSGWKVCADVVREAMRMRLMSSGFRWFTGFALAGLLAGAIFAWRTPDRFIASGTLRIGSAGMSAEELQSAVYEAVRRTESRMSLAMLMQRPTLNLYARERRSQPMEDVIRTMLTRDIHVRLTKGDGADANLLIEYVGENPAAVQGTANALMSSVIRELNLKQATFNMEAPRLPQDPIWPNRPVMAAVGLGAGAVFGILVLASMRWSRYVMAGFAVMAGIFAVSLVIPEVSESTATLELHGLPWREAVRALPEGMRGSADVTIMAVDTDEFLNIRARAGDRFQAQRLASEVTDAFMQSAGPAVKVLDPPSLPTKPLWISRLGRAALALLFGMLSFGVMIGRRFSLRRLQRA